MAFKRNLRIRAGAPAQALEHYRILHPKQVQLDTLSHYILSRTSNFSHASIGDLTFANECVESTQIYVANSQEVRSFHFSWADC